MITSCDISRGIKGVAVGTGVCSVTMVPVFYLVTLLVVTVVQAVDFSVECGGDFVTVNWPMGLQHEPDLDPSLVRLGYCSPTSVSVLPGGAQVVFPFVEWRCGAEMMALKENIVWSTKLTYNSESGAVFLLQAVVCMYQRLDGWLPHIFRPVIETFGTSELVFSMSLMNDDFSGPAVTSQYNLGNLIPISASVNQQAHQPLLLLLEECLASTEDQLGPETYPIITNKGCFTDSRKTMSRFQPRQRSSEIQLYLQAFAFALNQPVYIHCKLVAWEENGFNQGKKACHDKNGSWELLDNPAQSSLCSCCDYGGDDGCQSRKRRAIGGKRMTRDAVVGPLVIVNGKASSERDKRK
ncbi:zona pellucida sperm-binding protein 3-like [Alosa sapidissima]|uniref:zona pellucida sperm-binding protein 3-like n=1 Tax=Alosa sapidissima TaxID=34773 RepID=UPI001C0A2666|nr:zona pellucida sperm-binding protein 3-like [Alosa sapidissima]